MTDSYGQLTAAFADLTDRLSEYAGVWRDAIARNAAGTYRADDFLVDAQTLCGMGVRDMVLPPIPTESPSRTNDAASSSDTTFSRRLRSRCSRSCLNLL